MMLTARRSVRWLAAPTPAFKRLFHQQTVQHVLRDVRTRLSAVGVSGSDAKALVASALEPKLGSSSELFLWMDRQMTEGESNKLKVTLQRRLDGEPLAFVLGVKEFWSLELQVTRDTLIPRADSEVLIEYLSNLYQTHQALRILDLGTGSGALLLAALSEYPRATGVGVDVSAGALAVARFNAVQLGFDGRTSFLDFDMEDLPGISNPATLTPQDDQQATAQLFQRFDVILCNPPYIPLSEAPLIAPDVLAYEPHGALFSDGPDAWTRHAAANCHGEVDGEDPGLRFYIALRTSVEKLLDPRSSHQKTVLMEIGSERQALAVRDLFADVPSLTFDCFLRDAAHRHRGVVLRSRALL